jgi:uncharacterized repeat protein (TIGR01451 family)
VSTVTNGTLSLGANGSFLYTPSSNYVGTDAFTYRAYDAGATSAVAVVMINILATNYPPVANNDLAATPNNTPVSVPALVNDTDPDGDSLSITAISPTNGTATFTSTNVVFTPASNFVGTATISYTISDGNGGSGSALITVSVTNRPPAANGQSVTTVQNTPKAITLTGSDPDSDPLTFATVTPPANGTLSGFNTNTGAIAYTPNPTFIGNDSFTFRVNDGLSNSATATVNIAVGAQADLAVFKTGSASGGAGSNLTFTITVTNLGPSTASNVAVFDQLPASYSFVSATPTPASVTSNLVRWTAFNLAALGSSNFVVTVTPTNGGVFTNIASATHSTPDPEPANNDGTSTNSRVTTTVQALADVAVFKTGPTNVVAGGSITYTITVTNRGPEIATNTVVADTLPAGATLSIASGSFTQSNGVVRWVAVTLASGGSASYSITLIAPLSGGITNVVSSTSSTPDPNPSNNNGSSGAARVSSIVTPIADVAVFKTGPAGVTPGQSFDYTITVTNLGLVAAANVVVTDQLPTNLTFVSASPGGVFASNVVTWPAITSLASGETTNFTLAVIAPASGSFTNVILASASTPDPDPSNNDGTSTNSQVTSSVVPGQFGILQGPNVFNPQTGLFEQRVTVTNTGTETVAGVRLLVGGLRTNVTLYNATGTNFDLRPYVQYNAPLNPHPQTNSTVAFVLEFYVRDRRPFTSTLEAVAILPPPGATNVLKGVEIDVWFYDNRIPGEQRFVIEWASIPGRTYTIIYSDNGMVTWKVATPSITANANRTQWYDDGPPKTDSKPSNCSRLYRVILNPANP